MEKLTLYIKDLACPDCAGKIGEALSRHPGVISAQVAYATGRVKVEYDPSALTPADIKLVINSFGYNPQEKR
ncbi:MAG: heavy-metal-associated domain-containing protein [Bacillota bacterium]